MFAADDGVGRPVRAGRCLCEHHPRPEEAVGAQAGRQSRRVRTSAGRDAGRKDHRWVTLLPRCCIPCADPCSPAEAEYALQLDFGGVSTTLAAEAITRANRGGNLTGPMCLVSDFWGARLPVGHDAEWIPLRLSAGGRRSGVLRPEPQAAAGDRVEGGAAVGGPRGPDRPGAAAPGGGSRQARLTGGRARRPLASSKRCESAAAGFPSGPRWLPG